jgi:VWFA-related protein
MTRRKWYKGLVSRTFLRFILCLTALAASAGTQTVSVRVDVVNVNVIVKNGNNQPISGLQQSDFTLEEDGRPQQIKYFSRETELPLTLGLLIDVSDSMTPHLLREQEASSAFLERMIGPRDEAFIVRFGRNVDVIQPRTSSLKQLRSKLKELKSPGGILPPASKRPCENYSATALYDAIVEGAAQIPKARDRRSAIIVLTDGLEHNSCASLKTVIEKALQADAIVYVILYAPQLSQPAGYGKYREALNKIAFFTGGDIYDAGSAPIEAIYTTIEQELRQLYSLGYSSDQPPLKGAEYRRIKVTVRTPRAKAIARDGYFTREKTK